MGDRAVLARARRFGAIFDAYFAEIHRYVARRLDVDAADDIAAETFYVAFRRRRAFELSRDSARPWLYGIATNLITKHRRVEGRKFRALGRLGGERFDDGHAERVAAQVSAEQVTARLARVIGELSAESREVLLLGRRGRPQLRRGRAGPRRAVRNGLLAVEPGSAEPARGAGRGQSHASAGRIHR